MLSSLIIRDTTKHLRLLTILQVSILDTEATLSKTQHYPYWSAMIKFLNLTGTIPILRTIWKSSSKNLVLSWMTQFFTQFLRELEKELKPSLLVSLTTILTRLLPILGRFSTCMPILSSVTTGLHGKMKETSKNTSHMKLFRLSIEETLSISAKRYLLMTESCLTRLVKTLNAGGTLKSHATRKILTEVLEPVLTNHGSEP